MRDPERKQKRQSPRGGRVIEWLLWIAAIACLLPYVATWAARDYFSAVASTQAITHTEKTSHVHDLKPVDIAAPVVLPANQGLWSKQRLSAFEKLSAAFAPKVVASLYVPSKASQIPVFAGVTEAHMTLGAAHLRDSAPLDGAGNIALTAHRDGSFRILKDVEPGHELVLDHGGVRRVYEVKHSEVVSPDRVDVLDPTPVPTLTLITCHPFYFVGSAPDRYVLRAELKATESKNKPSFAERSPLRRIERSSSQAIELEE